MLLHVLEWQIQECSVFSDDIAVAIDSLAKSPFGQVAEVEEVQVTKALVCCKHRVTGHMADHEAMTA